MTVPDNSKRKGRPWLPFSLLLLLVAALPAETILEFAVSGDGEIAFIPYGLALLSLRIVACLGALLLAVLRPGRIVLIKLGMVDAVKGGLTSAESVQVVAALAGLGLDAAEISGGIGATGKPNSNVRAAIRSVEDEAYFRPLAKQARPVTPLPIVLVGGLRSRRVMDDVLDAGDADFIALCRPLICEPDFPNRLRRGVQERSSCISDNRCWPERPEDEGIACKRHVHADEAE